MNWHHLLIFCIFLGGCREWQSVYSNDQDRLRSNERLGMVAISPVYTVLGQQLYNALLDRQKKFDSRSAQFYQLDFKVSSTSRSQTTFTDGSASVTLRRYITRYTLSHRDKKQSFSSSTATTISQDNAPFSNAQLTEKADYQAMIVLAEAIIKRLAVFLRQNPGW